MVESHREGSAPAASAAGLFTFYIAYLFTNSLPILRLRALSQISKITSTSPYKSSSIKGVGRKLFCHPDCLHSVGIRLENPKVSIISKQCN